MPCRHRNAHQLVRRRGILARRRPFSGGSPGATDLSSSPAEDPPSPSRHLIGNLEAAPLESGEVEAKTAFLVYRSHLETDHQLLPGYREDMLRKVNGAWKVMRRTRNGPTRN